MTKKRVYQDWYAREAHQAKTLNAKLRASVPAQWATHVGLLQAPGRDEPFWQKSGRWLERMHAFKAAHGDALVWSLCDSEICDKARAIASDVGELLALWPAGLSEPERLDVVRLVCENVGVPAPVAITGEGAINRGLSDVWWRRVLRKKVARVVEHGAIKLGVVNRRNGGYASDGAVQRRMQQLARNDAMLSKTLMRNEAGQVYTLKGLADVSVANRDVRRGELMTRIRGCEEYADAAAWCGQFFTLTCPSRFHAVLSGGKGKNARPRANPRYENATPRDAQLWLRTMWARSRAELARLGVVMFGFRVAEPHHDGCPHWHALLWFSDAAQAEIGAAVIKKHWLSDGGDEPGAQKNRVDCKAMRAGGAAGYVAKYIAKNVGGNIDIGEHTDGLFPVAEGEVQGYQRVDAWAATWGIRQFQPIGQPPVTVWRELRRVTKDQVEEARVRGDGEAWRAWGAVHRGEGGVQACWAGYMRAQGGVCRGRGEWALQTAARDVRSVNQYGETVDTKKTVGVCLRSGRWLVSRRQRWARVVDTAVSDPVDSAAMAAPWTGFNNCTARLSGTLRAAFLGPGSWTGRGS